MNIILKLIFILIIITETLNLKDLLILFQQSFWKNSSDLPVKQ